MPASGGYTRASWDALQNAPFDLLPANHPWPSRETPTLRDYFRPLRCEHVVFSIGRLAPGQSVAHHRHEDAEEVYLLLRGRCQIRIGDDVIAANPLDAFRVPAELYRSVYNDSDTEAWWLFIGAPPDEYLEARE